MVRGGRTPRRLTATAAAQCRQASRGCPRAANVTEPPLPTAPAGRRSRGLPARWSATRSFTRGRSLRARSWMHDCIARTAAQTASTPYRRRRRAARFASDVRPHQGDTRGGRWSSGVDRRTVLIAPPGEAPALARGPSARRFGPPGSRARHGGKFGIPHGYEPLRGCPILGLPDRRSASDRARAAARVDATTPARRACTRRSSAPVAPGRRCAAARARCGVARAAPLPRSRADRARPAAARGPVPAPASAPRGASRATRTSTRPRSRPRRTLRR